MDVYCFYYTWNDTGNIPRDEWDFIYQGTGSSFPSLCSSTVLQMEKERLEGYLAIGDFAVGVVFTVIGLIGIFSPAVILSFLPFVTGAALILDGIVKAPVAIEMVKVGDAYHIPVVVAAVLPLLFGVFLTAFPFQAATALIMVFGIFLVIDGVCDIISVAYFRKYEKENEE